MLESLIDRKCTRARVGDRALLRYKLRISTPEYCCVKAIDAAGREASGYFLLEDNAVLTIESIDLQQGEFIVRYAAPLRRTLGDHWYKAVESGEHKLAPSGIRFRMTAELWDELYLLHLMQ